MILDENFGEMMKKTRERHALTLKELSERTDISDATLQRYESGKIKNIPVEKIYRIISVFDEYPNSIFTQEYSNFFLAFKHFSKLVKTYYILEHDFTAYPSVKIDVNASDFISFTTYYEELNRFQQADFVQFAFKELRASSSKEKYLNLKKFFKFILDWIDRNDDIPFFAHDYLVHQCFIEKYDQLDERGKHAVNETLERELSYIQNNPR